jgi:Mrp family chromosome partitioning ATPase
VINSKTPKQVIKKARKRLSTLHAKPLGILLNGVDIRTGEYGKYYRHYYDYYQDEPETSGGSKTQAAEFYDG